MPWFDVASGLVLKSVGSNVVWEFEADPLYIWWSVGCWRSSFFSFEFVYDHIVIIFIQIFIFRPFGLFIILGIVWSKFVFSVWRILRSVVGHIFSFFWFQHKIMKRQPCSRFSITAQIREFDSHNMKCSQSNSKCLSN